MDQLFVDDRIIRIILFLRKNEVSQKSLSTRTVPMYAACNHNFLYCLYSSLRFFHNIVMPSVFVNNQTGCSSLFIQFPKIFFSQHSDAFSVYQQPCT